MARTTLSTKGQVIIPQQIRERHGWTPGTRFEIEDLGDRVELRSVSSAAPATVDDLLGILPYRGRRRTIAEMDEGIARGARRRR